MSKLYKKYTLLKMNNPQKIYLFECGIFYLFIHEDAIIISDILNLKLTSLNSLIMKCGFPIKSADKYLNLLKTLNYDIEIIYANNTSLNNIIPQNIYDIIYDFLDININELSISQAFDLLTDLQNKLKKFGEKNEKKE